MLTPREIAAAAANEALGLGRGRVLGVDPADVAASRLEVVRRAQRAARAAIGTPRILLREVDDAALNNALTRLDRMARDLEGAAGQRNPWSARGDSLSPR